MSYTTKWDLPGRPANSLPFILRGEIDVGSTALREVRSVQKSGGVIYVKLTSGESAAVCTDGYSRVGARELRSAIAYAKGLFRTEHPVP